MTPPAPYVRELRQELIERLLRSQGELLPRVGADTSGQTLLDLLGWTPGALQRFVQADRVVVTLPHASPNVFFPRVGVGWYARHCQQKDPAIFHLRVVLTHTNFSDAGWKPYAWWYVNRSGELIRATIFTRNKRLKHVTVASQPALSIETHQAGPVDQEAAQWARTANNLATSSIVVMARIERTAGFTASGHTLYLPLDFILRCLRELAASRPGDHPWLVNLLTKAQGRRLTSDGELEETDRWQEAFVLDNASNIASLAALGCSGVVGGRKMLSYWVDVEQRFLRAEDGPGLDLPNVLLLPSSIDYSQFVAPSVPLKERLSRAGLEYSQGMAVTEHGSFGQNHTPFI